MTKNQKTIKIPENWLKRLQAYTNGVRETGGDDIKNRMAIVGLLGYLDSLIEIYKRKNL